MSANSKFDALALQSPEGATSPILCTKNGCGKPIVVEERRTFQVWRHTDTIGFAAPQRTEFVAVCLSGNRHEYVSSANEDYVIQTLQDMIGQTQ